MSSSGAGSFIASAYKLAYGILGGKEGILPVVLAAMDGIEGFMQEQDDRADADKPTKPVFDEAETFQYLLYGRLELAEKAQERGYRLKGESPEEQTMILRYLKCAIYNSINHTPFYLAVNAASLLYDYDWNSTEQVYNLVIQNQDSSKTQNKRNDRLRALKAALLRRFGALLHHNIDVASRLKGDSSR